MLVPRQINVAFADSDHNLTDCATKTVPPHSGVDNHSQAERGMLYHNLLDRALVTMA